jgi:hypothetical protein
MAHECMTQHRDMQFLPMCFCQKAAGQPLVIHWACPTQSQKDDGPERSRNYVGRQRAAGGATRERGGRTHEVVKVVEILGETKVVRALHPPRILCKFVQRLNPVVHPAHGAAVSTPAQHIATPWLLLSCCCCCCCCCCSTWATGMDGPTYALSVSCNCYITQSDGTPGLLVTVSLCQ